MMYQQQAEAHNWNQLHMAESMLESSNVDSAIAILAPVVQLGGRFEGADRALYNLALAYEMGGHEEAGELWDRLVSRYPKSPYFDEARLQQARRLHTQNPEQAQEIFKEIQDSNDPIIRGRALLSIAQAYDDSGNEQTARDFYYEILESGAKFEIIAQAKDRLSEMNTRMIWSGGLDEFSEIYTVERGDVPLTIANKYFVPTYYIEEVNNVSARNLRPGQRLKVLKGPLRVVVNKSRCRMDLLTESGRFIKWYPVGIGEESYKTPAGEYTIQNKMVDPTWYRPGGGVLRAGHPDNALGSRWLGIGGSLGIHGTNEPETIGYPMSAGCIRMHNHDVEELFKILFQGARVTIIEEEVEAGIPS